MDADNLWGDAGLWLGPDDDDGAADDPDATDVYTPGGDATDPNVDLGDPVATAEGRA